MSLRFLLPSLALLAACFALGPGCVLDWDRGSGSTPTMCSAGGSCSCTQASCSFTGENGSIIHCGDATSCDVTCNGIGCEIFCDTATTCTASCPNGPCTFHCGMAGTCSLSCPSAICSQD